ncbi:hypothetical protein AB3X96_35030 [Paraburkholderia sp. BR13439]|uniref:hypothetical protein n=1 Tax=unclassified Paraburkholderia TaxID=2615204 RepID=UPI0034CFB889
MPGASEATRAGFANSTCAARYDDHFLVDRHFPLLDGRRFLRLPAPKRLIQVDLMTTMIVLADAYVKKSCVSLPTHVYPGSRLKPLCEGSFASNRTIGFNFHVDIVGF